jgi:hypothetical protein
MRAAVSLKWTIFAVTWALLGVANFGEFPFRNCLENT